MTLLEIKKECLVSGDEMKVMIACNHTQCIAVWQQDWMLKKSWMDEIVRDSDEATAKVKRRVEEICVNT